MSENNVLPVILAGGKSRRFGGNKANAKLGDLTLIDHTIQKLKNRFKEILDIFISHRREVVTRRTTFDLNKAKERGHVVEGLMVAIANIDEIKMNPKFSSLRRELPA